MIIGRMISLATCTNNMTIGIHQPNYLPYEGYFEKMRRCDTFVVFDDVQLPMSGHFYETRAIINGVNGPITLTIPVENRGHHLIRDTRLADGRWRAKHLKSIVLNYPQSPILDFLADIYNRDWKLLLDFNLTLIHLLADQLGIKAKIMLSSELGIEETGTNKILGIIEALGGDTYISGTGNGSRRYVDATNFLSHGVQVIWHEYSGPNVSVIDSLLRDKAAR